MIDTWHRDWHRDTWHRATDQFDDFLDEKDRKHAETERKKTFEEALDRGLEDSFTGSDPVSVTQPPPSARDKDRP